MIDIEKVVGIGSNEQFESVALELFRLQAVRCEPYRDYIAALGVDPQGVRSVGEIPFMPISMFKSHKIYCGEGLPQKVFTSSNTGGTQPSEHPMERLSVYERCFTEAFRLFYGDPREVSIYGLLPNYLQRDGSSLIYMVDRLIAAGRGGGFYLDDYDGLLADMTRDRGPKILLGVSYALWDLAESRAPKLENTVVMETGGMKGQREELPKEEFHAILTRAFGVDRIHSEYGMAELTSQAYSAGVGVFCAPPWMRVLVRDVNDPFDIRSSGRGGMNIVDLGNLSSCAFIQTQDMGRVDEDGRFEVLGRIDNSEIRGCNLLIQ